MHVQAHHPQSVPLSTFPNPGVAQTARPMAAASSAPSTPTSTSTATITANDFLQLLVTELQNQDPTSDTDPNEYVDQLVQVNSLQQQIQMNETMDGGPTLTGSSSGLLQELVQINQTLEGSSSGTSSSNTSAYANPKMRASGIDASAAGEAGSAALGRAAGNLSATADQKTLAAAQKVASALAPSAGYITGNGPMQAFEEFAARLKAGAPQK